MVKEPDLRFDIDALYDHLTNNLGHNIEDEQDWAFSLRSHDLAALEEVAHELEEEFVVQLQETVEEVDVDGKSSLGDPLLTIVRRGALTADEVKAIVERLRAIAKQRGVVYDGVDCYDPIEEEEVFGWLAPEDAGWRLRHMTDCGLEDNAELPWAFLVLAPDVDSARMIADELATQGFADDEISDQPDEDGSVGLCVFVAGRNNESELSETGGRIGKIAERHRGHLEGIQFCTREDMNEGLGAEDDD